MTIWRPKIIKPKHFRMIIWKDRNGNQGDGFYTGKHWINMDFEVLKKVTYWKPSNVDASEIISKWEPK